MPRTQKKPPSAVTATVTDVDRWANSINCAGDVMQLLKQLETAGWEFLRRTGEYALVICKCGDEHFGRVILWPSVPSVFESAVRQLEASTCFRSE